MAPDFKAFFDASPAPIIVVEPPNWSIVAANRARLEITDTTLDQQLGRPLFDVFPDDPADPTADGVENLTASLNRVMTTRRADTMPTQRYAVRDVHGAFVERWWSPINIPVLNEKGEVAFIIHQVEEVTETEKMRGELVTAQDQLRQSQKMEAMGQLTGGVAHDFNNLLMPILGSLDMLQRRGLGDERDRRLIDGALQSAERARVLVQRLLAFARRQPLQRVAVNLATLVQGLTGLLETTVGPTIAIQTKIEPDLPLAIGDPNQLEMAVVNLAVNARDAMGNGGALVLIARRESVRDGHRSGLTSGEYLYLAVVDTGSGMEEETLQRAVEPFFSTKGIGRGTGLGLSMVHGLTAQLGGALTLQSKIGQGTTVELWLPKSDAPVVVSKAGDAESRREAIRGRVLLVDDEELVRTTTADMLVDLGFEVIEAASAPEALNTLELVDDVRLVVTDHLMPGCTGVELRAQIRANRPDLPILIVSGYAETEGIAADLPRLTKPFRSNELAEAVRRLLAEPSPGIGLS